MSYVGRSRLHNSCPRLSDDGSQLGVSLGPGAAITRLSEGLSIGRVGGVNSVGTQAHARQYISRSLNRNSCLTIYVLGNGRS
jgi:hypothetical protein